MAEKLSIRTFGGILLLLAVVTITLVAVGTSTDLSSDFLSGGNSFIELEGSADSGAASGAASAGSASASASGSGSGSESGSSGEEEIGAKGIEKENHIGRFLVVIAVGLAVLFGVFIKSQS